MELKHRAFSAGLATLSATRADRWLRPLSVGSGAILMFHHVRPPNPSRFDPNKGLEVTPGFLEQVLDILDEEGFETVSLDEVPERLARPRGGRPFAVITFDDGYSDNLRHAWPILRRRKVPWTIYLTPAYAQGTGRLWWRELERAVSILDEVEVEIDDCRHFHPAKTVPQKERAFRVLVGQLRTSRRYPLLAAMSRLNQRAGTDPRALTQSLCASWDELAGLAADPLVTIGAHTLTHPVLARRAEAAAFREIALSRAAVEEKLGRRVEHFAYPHGDRAAAGLREFVLAERAGYRTAVTTRPGHLWPEHADLLIALPRLSINGLHQTEDTLRVLLSGAAFLPWRWRNEARRIRRTLRN